MNRYIDDMSREELVEEVVDLLRRGVFHHHEVFDPTILPRDVLCQNVKRLRLRMLREHRVVIEVDPDGADGADHGGADHGGDGATS